MFIKSVLIIRHAESIEDVDPTMHNITDDSLVGLTLKGLEQASNLSLKFQKSFSKNKKIGVYLSPTRRARETWDVINKNFSSLLFLKVDSRLKNLNWGDVTLENKATIEKQRYKAGVEKYIFPNGENTPRYINAIKGLLNEVVYGKNDSKIDTLVIITHGFALRVILMHLLELPVERFRWLKNPPNCYTIQLTRESPQEIFVSDKDLSYLKAIV